MRAKPRSLGLLALCLALFAAILSAACLGAQTPAEGETSSASQQADKPADLDWPAVKEANDAQLALEATAADEGQGQRENDGSPQEGTGPEEDASAKVVTVGFYQDDYRFQNGFTDATRKSGYAYEYLQALAGLTGWNYRYVYGSRSDIMTKLEHCEVDLVAGIYNTDVTRDKMLFSSRPIGLEGEPRYFAVSKERPDLLEELNQAQAVLLAASPDFQLQLLQRYYYTGTVAKVLTPEENRWLAERGKLRLGYVRGNPPVSEEGEDGLPEGLVAEMNRQLSSFLQMPVEPVSYESVPAMLRGLHDGEVDVAFPVHADYWVVEREGLSQTEPVMSDRDSILFMGAYTEDMLDRVALRDNGLRQRNNLVKDYPRSQFVSYPSTQEAFEAVIRGEAGCVLGASSVIQRFLAEHPEYDGYNTAQLDTAQEYVFLVTRDNPVLLGILNKVASSVDKSSLTAAVIRYSTVEDGYSLGKFVRRHSLVVIATLLAVIAVSIAVFVAYRVRNERFNRAQAASKAKLEEALDAAKAASEAKSTFLSSMSHDIRTPMNGIVGMTAIAEANLHDPARVEECLGKIASSSHYLLGLINNVLDMSKIEANRLSLNLAPTDLVAMAERMVALNRTLAEEKHQSIEAVCEGVEHPWVLCDHLRLQQVVANLLSNAVKYTQDGGSVVLRLRETGCEEAGASGAARASYAISVEDNGVGMSEEYLPHLFEAFTRENTEASPVIQGTGLGLAIVDNLTRLMGGTVEVKSRVGEGSTFTVKVAFETCLAGTADKNLSLGPGEGDHGGLSPFDMAEELDFSGRRALLVEDNELNAEIAREFLELTGLVLERACNGAEAVEMVVGSPEGYYDCIFMDIQMPVMNGLEATAAIRSLDRPDVAATPIFAMTADAFAEDVEESHEAGMNEHFSKPLDFVEVFSVVGRYLV